MRIGVPPHPQPFSRKGRREQTVTLPKLGGTSWLLCSQCAYFELIACIHKPVPSPWGEGQGEGTRVWDAGHSEQLERQTRFIDKREGGISLPLLFSNVISGV
ncbi:hypothetical protein AMS64_10325 [Aeromonas veronii]|nr:hypothetical protein AMS64_10325 [Aeromonas veronii]POG20292.1 hypothetical protein C2849_05625 [Aeromonas veronii]